MYSFPNPLPRPEEQLEDHFKFDHTYWAGCADSNLVDAIVSLGESLEKSGARTGSSYQDSSCNNETRVSQVSWIRHNPESQFLFDYLTNVVDRINYHHYGMILTGMEEFQYTCYPPGGHYVYHNDIIVNKDNMRKLSIVMGLSDPSEYTGGEFVFMPHGRTPKTMRFNRGDLIAFPSWVPHKVEPVTSGLRRSLVSWVYGPKFI